MLNIYLADLTGLGDFYNEKVNMLHRERAEKISAYKMPADRIRGLGAGLLLERGLEDYLYDLRTNIEATEGGTGNGNAYVLPNDGNISNNSYALSKDENGRCVIRYGYGPQGKPYLKDYPDIHFSLSHSGNMAVLALSDREVGIDVQEYRGYNEKIANRFYHEKEIKMLESVSEPEKKEMLFYKIWTGKEAYIKYTGKGMGEELNGFYWEPDSDVIYKDADVVKVYDVSMDISGYQCSVVSDFNTQKIDKIMKILL